MLSKVGAGTGIVLLLAFITLIVCTSGEQIPRSQGVAMINPVVFTEPSIIVVIIDDTGSDPYFEQGKALVAGIAAAAGRNTLLYVIVIDNRVEENADIRVRPDRELLAKAQRVIPGITFDAGLTNYRRNLQAQVSKLEYHGVRGTDVYGAFYYATQCLQGEEGYRKYLIVCSDLGDTVGRTDLESKISLQDVAVECLYFPTELIVEQGQNYRPDEGFWNRKISGWGATSVNVWNHIKSDRKILFEDVAASSPSDRS